MKTIGGILLICFILFMACLGGLAAMGMIFGSFLLYFTLMTVAIIGYLWVWVTEKVSLLRSLLSAKFLTIWPGDRSL